MVPFATLPNAECELNVGGTISKKLYADDLGVVRLHVRPSQATGEQISLTASCTAEGQSQNIQIELRAGPEPTPDMPAPATELAVQSSQRLGSERPALTGDPDPIPAEDLQRMGYPPRPDPIQEPQAYAAWLRIVSMPFRSITPKVVVEPDRYHSNANSAIWCGHAQTNGPGTFTAVNGERLVPFVSAPSSSFNGEADAAVWVGLDGWQTPNNAVVQAGSDSELLVTLGSPPFHWTFNIYFTWYEWFPAPSVKLTNVPVKPAR
jgi:hypothetical protein